MWWYRLLKVLHIFFGILLLIGIFIGTLFGLREEVAFPDIDTSRIYCQSGKIFSFRHLGIENTQNNTYWTESSLSNEEKSRIKSKCHEDYMMGDLVLANDSYKIDIKKKTSLSDKAVILGIAIVALVLYLLAEYLLRHVFYYIVLGKFNPHKK